jgi:hypothetical protein
MYTFLRLGGTEGEAGAVVRVLKNTRYGKRGKERGGR